MNERHIEVWYDETSDAEEPVYCVSLCDEDGGEIRCLSTHEDRDEAEAAGRKKATNLGIPAVFRALSGETTDL